jgi:hypothetical protein
MESFPTCGGAGCHTQLDQLLQSEEYGVSPVTPESAPPAEAEPFMPESPRIPMLPVP